MKLQKCGFSMLEMMMAMTIFAVMGIALYGMFSTLTTLQTTSLGIQRFKNEGHQIVEKIAEEVSEALTNSHTVFPYEEKINANSKKVPIQPEFICLNSVDANNNLAGVNKDIQQLYFCRNDYQFDIAFKSEKVFWKNVNLSERILYLCYNGDLKVDRRTEAVSNGEKNYVDGKANINDPSNSPETLGSDIDNIEYLFWGNTNRDWESYGNPVINDAIQEWNSTVTNNELPRAMKILLTMTYNPERDHRRKADVNADKNQKIIIEKIVVFKHRDH